MKTSLDNFEALGMRGLCVRVEGKLVAFGCGCMINHDTFDMQLLKSDAAYNGASPTVLHELAKQLPDTCKYMNLEEDLGIEGLRTIKLRYLPLALLVPVILKI